ncbi:MAG TPA: 2-dehydropantoate 2-reductase [Desulfuromonadales bacterium]|nr:2-dehydropantoate 2-reductase [Desulfuromonadales bacterium]
MKIAIVGAGAIGGWLGVGLARSGQEVSVFARGVTREAIRQRGLRLSIDGETKTVIPPASDDASELGPQDLIIIAVKEPSLAAVAPAVAQMLQPETVVLPAMNGVPWWFAQGLESPIAGMSLRSVDPDGSIAALLPTPQVLGCVVHASASVSEPGSIRHNSGNGLIIGEPDGRDTSRVRRVRDVLAAAGFDVTVSPQIQRDIWYKLWGNMTMNPISALTGATTDCILDNPLVSAFVLAVMAEASDVGSRIGCPIAESGEDRMQVTRRLGAFKTSMLQDAEAGRPLEIDALLAAPREVAAAIGIATPHMDALCGLIQLYQQHRLEKA